MIDVQSPESRERLFEAPGISGRWRIGLAGSVVLAMVLTAPVPRAAASDAVPAAPLPVVAPAQAGLRAERFAAIDELVAQGIRDRKLPGAVVLVGHRGQLVHRRAYGQRRVLPEAEAREMTLDTVFDLASLTKPIATATSIHRLIEQGKLELEAPVARYLPDFAASGKEGITIRHLLLHTSGLIPDNPIADYALGPQKAWENLIAIKPVSPLGEKFKYSDVNFLILGKLVETVSGQPLDKFAREQIFAPLAMQDTGYNPDKTLLPRIAPTEKRGDSWITGFVHDPRAFALGGVAGHAGLFSTADDLAIYAQTLLQKGEFRGKRILTPESVARMTAPHEVPGGLRTCGWDNRSAFSGNRGTHLSDRAFGHGGFTGTGIWIDPQLELFVIFLSSRLHPSGDGAVNPLIGKVCDAAAESLGDEPPAAK
ncbi:MAG: serine hydrolase domain-containing protein [Pirellulales bacterium]